MMKVKIYKLNNQAKQELIVECALVDNIVECSGDEQLVHSLNTEGIKDYTQTPGAKLFPKDGLKFLEQLKYNFKSGYLNATNIITEEE